MYLLPQKNRREFCEMNEKTNERIALETEAAALVARLGNEQVDKILYELTENLCVHADVWKELLQSSV